MNHGPRSAPPAGSRSGFHNGPLAVALAGAVALAFQWPVLDRWFSAMDEGHMLHFADLVTRGGLLYRDATIYPLPGSFYLLAAAFQLFEPSILVSRWLVAIEFSLFVATSFALVRRIVPPAGAWACVIGLLLYRVWAFPHWHIYSYSTTALLVLSASLLLLVRHLASGRRAALLGSGLLFGIGVYCKQDYAAAALLASLTCLVVAARSAPGAERPRLAATLAGFLLPAAAVGALAGLHFLAQGLLMQVVQFTVLNHFVGLSTYTYSPFPPLLPLFVQDPALRDPVGLHNLFPGIAGTVHGLELMQSRWFTETALYDTAVKAFIFGPRLWIAAGAMRLWHIRDEFRDPDRRPRALTELALFAFAASFMLLAALYRPQDYLHLAVLTAPLVWLAVVYGDALWRWRPRVAAGLAAAALVPGVAFAAYSGWLFVQLRELHSAPIEEARGGVWVKPIEAEMIAELVAYARKEAGPDERLAVMPYFSIVQFLAERDGPHGASYIVWPFPEYPDRDRRIIDAMRETGTRRVLWNFTQFPNFPPASEYAPELFAYLVDHFEIDRIFTYEAFGYDLAGLRPQQPLDGRPLLGGQLPEDGLWVERRGVAHPVPPLRRNEMASIGRWPFRPVVALRPSARGGRTVLSLRVAVPKEGGRLRSAVGVHPRAWFRYPATPVRFALEAVGPTGRVPLFTRVLNPHLMLDDRGWFDVDVSLDAFAGREVELQLSTATEGRLGESLWMGGWEIPRLVTPAQGKSS